MQILALVGSPRKGGNTEILVDELPFAAQTKGHEVRKVRLAGLSIGPCRDCRACKRGDDHSCAVDDDMTELYEELAGADVLVFGTPIYWYGPTAQMKALVDRLRPFVGSGSLRGKTCVLVLPSEEGPACCGPTRALPVSLATIPPNSPPGRRRPGSSMGWSPRICCG